MSVYLSAVSLSVCLSLPRRSSLYCRRRPRAAYFKGLMTMLTSRSSLLLPIPALVLPFHTIRTNQERLQVNKWQMQYEGSLQSQQVHILKIRMSRSNMIDFLSMYSLASRNPPYCLYLKFLNYTVFVIGLFCCQSWMYSLSANFRVVILKFLSSDQLLGRVWRLFGHSWFSSWSTFIEEPSSLHDFVPCQTAWLDPWVVLYFVCCA